MVHVEVENDIGIFEFQAFWRIVFSIFLLRLLVQDPLSLKI